jgi:hypothetical protein
VLVDPVTGTDTLTLADENGNDLTLKLGSTDQIALYNGGLWASSPTTDVDPHDIQVNGADAWSQATAGQRDGMDVNISSGIRTLQLVCADRTVADQDLVTITVNGANTVLTESTDFDCEGEASEEVCCDNLGAAITTALGASTVVPDCDTTAGTCYLQFDQRTVYAVDDITYTDGGVDGVFGTLTEGVDGDVNIHTAHNALQVTPNSILIGDGTSAYPALGFSADNDGTGTGIKRGAANRFNIITNGVSRSYWTTAQFVTELPVNINGHRVFDSSAALNLGGTYAATRGGVTGSVTIGKDAGSISLEVEGLAYFESDIVAGGYVYVSNLGVRPLSSAVNLQLYSAPLSTAAATQPVYIYSGGQTNAGDFASGAVNIASGPTTDADGGSPSGPVNIYSGAAGGGAFQADAGDVVMSVNGAPGSGETVLTLYGATGDAAFGSNLSIGELLYLDDDGDSYITGTNTDDVVTIFNNDGVGTGYTEIVNSNGAGAFSVGRTTATESSLLSITDGGADNEPGLLALFDDGGTGHYLWASTADVLRGLNSDPADDDAGGYAIMSFADGTIGAPGQQGTFDDVTLADDLLLADGAAIGITGNEVITFDAAGTVTVSGATLDTASAKGARTAIALNVESVTFPGGGGAASQVTVGSLIPDGAILDGISTYVTTADNGGACTGYTVGDGADDDLYGVAATETQGTTTDPTSATASISNPQFGGPFEVTITGTGGNCIDMVVRITAHYRLITADTTL